MLARKRASYTRHTSRVRERTRRIASNGMIPPQESRKLRASGETWLGGGAWLLIARGIRLRLEIDHQRGALAFLAHDRLDLAECGWRIQQSCAPRW